LFVVLSNVEEPSTFAYVQTSMRGLLNRHEKVLDAALGLPNPMATVSFCINSSAISIFDRQLFISHPAFAPTPLEQGQGRRFHPISMSVIEASVLKILTNRGHATVISYHEVRTAN
jgi:hypothetical protein